MDNYYKLIEILKKYFKNRNVSYIFCSGGCFYFANKVHNLIKNSSIWWNRKLMHCAICYEGKLYDITGRINKEGFIPATKKDIKYMEKNFIPNFDKKELDIYINLSFN